MALAQQMSTFGTKHPSLNFIAGLAIGVMLTAVATFGVVTLGSEDAARAGSPGWSEVSQEWTAARVLAVATGSSALSDEDAVLAAAAPSSPAPTAATSSAARAAALDESLFAGAGVFEDTGVGAVSAAADEDWLAVTDSLFAGSGVFEETRLAAYDGSGFAGPWSDAQTFLTEQEYRASRGITEGPSPAIGEAADWQVLTPEWRADTEG